jgi:5-deoxy-glucuronate isomerase
MISRHQGPFRYGYTPIAESGGRNASMLLDFGILRLKAGDELRDGEAKERAFLLMSGTVELAWSGQRRTVSRRSLLNEDPWVLHVPAGVEVNIRASGADAEIAVEKSAGPHRIEARLYGPGECRSQEFGKGTMQDTSTRIVRTVFDAGNEPGSAMVMGEVVNFPGKWSSYPPHNHPQPEIYHFRFFPEHGFGYSEQGDEVYKVRHRDTALIPPDVTHPQTAAPGYAMYYLWMIPHLENERFGPDSRRFLKEHEWLLDPAARIWPERPE